ncbi:MAG: TonB-dependent copper receptor [Azoarcus sp.]|jgi:iron complex outermembrane receptor protein|nr:TonB-dependent copper receptor [Azoarcus sp.]
MSKYDSGPRAAQAALAVFAVLASGALFAQQAHEGHEGHEGRAGQGAAPPTLDTVVVTASAMDAPLEVNFDPKAPQQPLPANDGASFLKTVPGMSVVRKGGTGGDPMFRGMAASRLNILLDGEQILGGCGGRMDPPTAYIFPDAYDRVTLLKGPQSVVYGPASAGTVLFERVHKRYEQPDWRLNAAATGASAGRFDGYLDVKGGNAAVYGEGILTRSRSDDYRDGGGKKVHARYERQSLTGIVGLTPDEATRLELSAIKSDGEAAYADRGMDGSQFERENVALKFEKRHLASWLDKVQAQAYYNYIDHVMDNYSLRTPVGMAMASNPDRKSTGGRFAATLLPGGDTILTLGVDRQENIHTARSGGPRGSANDYHNQKRRQDFRFASNGFFGELRWQASAADSVIAGLRNDQWQAKDSRAGTASATSGAHRRESLWSGFMRYEREWAQHGIAYLGVGRSARAPDYWEIGKASESGNSVFDRIEPEITHQLDLGLTWQSGAVQGFVSAFYGKLDDYILIESRYPNGTGTQTIARNVDATLWGGEAGASYRFAPQWKGSASLAYTHGENDSDHHALGQIPPLEGRLGLDWQRGAYSAGALLRLVVAQNRYARNEGNIVGQDLGRNGGFAVFSLNGSYRLNKSASFSVGVDNLFDRKYAEFISKSGADVTGYEQTARVNEPGRTFWLRAQVDLD